MTGMEPSGPSPKDDRRPHEAVPEAPTQGRGEVLVEPGAVVVTFHLPELEPDDLEYRVGSRTVSLWSTRPGVDFRTIVVLPLWINPGQFMVSHKNGVYEFLMEPHPAPAGVAA